MKSLFILIDSLFQLYLWIVIINAILGWLVTFNIINTSNRFVYSLIEFSYRLTEPVLRKIRMVLPNIASIDFSPVVLVLGLIFIRNLIFELDTSYVSWPSIEKVELEILARDINTQGSTTPRKFKSQKVCYLSKNMFYSMILLSF